MDSTGVINIETAVTDYLLGYKKTTEEYIVYLKHALDLLTDFMIHDSREARSEKVSVDSNGIIEFPSDCIRVKDIAVGFQGEWWTFTERNNMINTTTTTAGVEGHDSDFGEGVSLRDGITTTYGAKGGVNSYYYTIDRKARRVFCDGITSDTVLMRYVSSGVSITGITYIPRMLVPMLENYLLFKETFWEKSSAREADQREKRFKNERIRVRNVLNSLTAAQWKDVILGSATQTPKR